MSDKYTTLYLSTVMYAMISRVFVLQMNAEMAADRNSGGLTFDLDLTLTFKIGYPHPEMFVLT